MGAIGLGTHTAKKYRHHCQTSTTVDTLRPQAEGSHGTVEKETEVRNWDSRIQLQLKEDGGSGSRQNRIENLVCDVCSFMSKGK